MAVLEPPMLTQEQAVEVKVLRRQGHSVRAIARETGLSRVTVRRYLQDPEETKRYGPRAPRACKLDRYTDYLRARIEAARPAWIPATVLLREIRERGYTGGMSLLRQTRPRLLTGSPAPRVVAGSPGAGA
jgi:transposase